MGLEFYGIPNCDTVKKARQWLEAQGIAYTFHDYKKEGADPAKVKRWIDEKGWEVVLNRRGTTFRGLPDAEKEALDADRAVKLMVAHPSTIKRPVIEHGGGILVGFDQEEWAATLT